ncbi:hypothetical protein [Polaribacter aestuariivivens]|uniref:hypothetical protein n=1 Tax=Polaribacter aestuariivivens TaxID=2304626 RepID=UPI003F4950E1
MEKHWKLSNEEFENKFSKNTFRPLWFTHEAHLRLAWIYINKYDKEIALNMYRNQLYDFAIKYKAETKFNATITFASIQIMSYYINKSVSNNFENFIAEFPQLKNNFKEILRTHYSSDIFTSAEAKKNILQPDLVAF